MALRQVSSLMEATTAAVLASAIVSTAGGMVWLVIQLPHQLASLQSEVQEASGRVKSLDDRFGELEAKIRDHERRIGRLER